MDKMVTGYGITLQIKFFLYILLGERACCLCGTKDLASLKMALCRECQIKVKEQQLSSWGNSFCKSCGQVLLGQEKLCSDCKSGEILVDNHSLFLYRGCGKDLIYFYKFKGERRLAHYFALQIHHKIVDEEWGSYTLVPIPPAKGKIFKKGWDQIDLILDILHHVYSHNVSYVLTKGAGKVQKTLDREDRKTSIKGQFQVMGNIPSKALLIDDVMTTGATLNECYCALYNAGVGEIRSITIARD